MNPGRVLSLAWRESRFARGRLLLFLSAISLGVAALVAVRGFAASMAAGVRQEARALLGADLRIESRQPFGPGTAALLDSLEASGRAVARVTSFASMAYLPRTGGTRLAQVRAAEPAYPFYGEIETRPAGVWRLLRQGRNAIVDPALLTSLGARVGDSISVGESRFEIVGAVHRVPGDVEIASSFAPRVFIPNRYVHETELIGFGSRVDYEAYVRIPRVASVDRLLEDYRPMFRTERTRTDTVEEQQDDLEDALGRLSDYLALVGVLALLLGGIGVASAMSAYMERKSDVVAILRCLGATSSEVLAVYLVQAGVMGLAGAAIGVALGGAVQWLIPHLARGLLPLEAEMSLDPLVLVTGLGVGLATALAFAALPLLAVRRITPLAALRRRVEAVSPPRDPLRIGVIAGLAVFVVLLLAFQVDDLLFGLQLAAGIAAALAALWATAWLVMAGMRKLRRDSLPYAFRQGVANLYRPRNQTRTVVVALGFGAFLLATLILVQHNLLLPLRTGDPETRPNLLFWDVQEDQLAGIDSLLADRGMPILQSAPIVPMRIAAINGREVRLGEDDLLDPVGEEYGGGGEAAGEADPEQEPERWAVRREYRSTFRDTLVASEELSAGEWWSAAPEEAVVSLETDIASDLGVEIGDRITWDVQGVRIPTRVGSLRDVDWSRFEPNFFAVFPRAVLEPAPRTWVLLTRAGTARERALVQRDVVARYSNVAILDLTRVQQALDTVIGRVSTVIRFLAGFSVATGLIVLLGAVSTSRAQRIRESVLLKTIGATRRQIGAILLTEYLSLGAAAGIAGTLLSVVAGWALATGVFDVEFEVTPLPLLALAGTVAILTAAVGLWASRDVYGRTAMEGLREE